MHFSTILALLLVTACKVLAGYNATSKNNVAVYWGQNSAGHASKKPELQQRLSHYCKSDSVDIIIIAFILQLDDGTGKPLLNFANQGYNCTEGNNLICYEIGSDIQTCQGSGKTVLLSMGGDSAPGRKVGAFKTEDAAIANAEKIWKMFGPETEDGTISRPFGNAVIDGFDLDPEDISETDTTYMVKWATKMRDLLNNNSDGKKRYLTVAPQCPAPVDNGLLPILNATHYDMFFVQFYNNPDCHPASTNYSFSSWDTWVKDRNGTKVFMGLPAQSDAAPNGGFLAPSGLGDVLEITKNYTSLGGIMLWDASQAWREGDGKNYHDKAKTALSELG